MNSSTWIVVPVIPFPARSRITSVGIVMNDVANETASDVVFFIKLRSCWSNVVVILSASSDLTIPPPLSVTLSVILFDITTSVTLNVVSLRMSVKESRRVPSSRSREVKVSSIPSVSAMYVVALRAFPFVTAITSFPR